MKNKICSGCFYHITVKNGVSYNCTHPLQHDDKFSSVKKNEAIFEMFVKNEYCPLKVKVNIFRLVSGDCYDFSEIFTSALHLIKDKSGVAICIESGRIRINKSHFDYCFYESIKDFFNALEVIFIEFSEKKIMSYCELSLIKEIAKAEKIKHFHLNSLNIIE